MKSSDVFRTLSAALSQTELSLADITLYALGTSCVALLGAYLYLWPYRAYTLPFKNLQGPEPDSWFFGSMRRIIKEPPLAPHQAWLEQYGPTYRYRLFFGSWRFFTADPLALSYILNHSDLFPKTGMARREMETILGRGVLIAEGEDHKRQRKVLNPSFSLTAVRGMLPIFYDSAYELRDKLQGLIEDPNAMASPTPAKEEDKVEGGKKVDVMKYLGQATIDVIGKAGFDYDFQALKAPTNELADAYRSLFSTSMTITPMAILQALFPVFKKLPTKRMRVASEAIRTTKRIGMRLLEEKKQAVRKAHSEGLEKGTDIGRDLLSILVKANMASDLKPEQRMSDSEVLAQITTFMLAGNETSATALSWICYVLSMHQDVQDRLREEVTSVSDDRPSFETLTQLPYMDKVIREVLRLYPPAPSTVRQAEEATTLPLSKPVKGRDGKMIDHVNLPKGCVIFVPIMCINISTDVWGPDASTFNPDRYDNLPSSSNQVPGVWGNLLTFLGGTRNCIGYRFALAEIKAILFVLIRSMKFEELPSKPQFEKKAA
ncbi:hypothetical protein M231_04224 [Tremella mesenterica]|uniref:Cytochrome P450 n=1 Tax=Tremella mesenterica TaxID=5217 RepID=A0A4Q1BL03_TREME|nr:hypothetical protein M231_04224 [Tremella mesenterica]